ncbi:MAG: hypothetical protein CIT01_09120 [Methanobacterium sp. BRmetb2]|nr:MAG: hypothetical protein CIT01_09120 [Methanobacterium sp. BRmetb2]
MKKHLILVVLVLAFVVAVSGCTSDTQSETYSSEDNASSGADSSSGNSGSQLKILSSNAHRDSIGNYIIDGEVQNTGNTDLSYVEIYATGYDSSGNVVTTDNTYADMDSIPAGGKSGFKVYLDDEQNQIVKYELQASG